MSEIPLRRMGAEERHVYAELMRVTGAHIRSDYPDRLAPWREAGPVHEINLFDEMGARSPASLHDGPVFSVFSYEGVLDVYRDPATFSSEAVRPSFGKAWGKTLITEDPPEHTALRNMVQPLFTRRTAELWKREMFEPVVRAYVESILPLGGADLQKEVFLPFPVAIIHRLMGLDRDPAQADRFHERLDALGVPHRSVPCGRDVSPRLARAVVAAVRTEKPHLLHTHLVHGDVYGAIASRVTGVPFLSTRHNDDRYLLGPFRYVDRAFARRARRLIAISDAVRAFLEEAGHDPTKLTTIRYGLDELPSAPSSPTPAEAGIPDGVPLALAVGRLIEQKDHATLLRAFARVHAAHPDARLAILGGGPLEAETRSLAGIAPELEVVYAEDEAKVRLANAAQANKIPGIDLSELSPERRADVLKALNTELCTCGCGLTLAQCRLDDPDCGVSLPLAQELVKKVAAR